ncbi:substrate-binding domain-containing protein [Streptomyces afghaniensis]|uniref:substrate-binding domain-containing protein n=1 Tax=Streptomyces afghaniensis TaxID=66865 RepID=UPI0033A26DB9
MTAVMCPTDDAALRALEVLDRVGVRVPQQLSITGFDGIALLTTPLLGITTLRQPLKDIGRRAIDLVLAQILGATRPVSHLALPGILMPGRTTAPSSAHD